MSLARIRLGELLATAGAVCLIVSLTLPSYENAEGKLSAWSAFGPAVLLLIVAAIAALALLLANVTERSPALPVASAVWCVLFGVIAVIAAILRLLERPQHATSLCAGAWLGLVGAVAVLLGAWQSIRDERTSQYEPAAPEPRRLSE
jgi:Na+/H+ antiporter NhaC